jgi:hypothetical protein
MRPIRINNSIKIRFEKLIDDELDKYDSVLSKTRRNILELEDSLHRKCQIEVLNDITANFKEFILKTPEDQEILVKLWGKKYPNLFYSIPKKGRRKSTNTFGQKILRALNYNAFRKEYADKIIDIIGLKTCPYCNAMLAIVVPNCKGKQVSRFQLDHYYPKSKYPLLSISLFNLIPSCGNCNIRKGRKNVKLSLDFHLYGIKTPLNAFKFKIPSSSVSTYLSTNNIEDIEIDFENGIDADKKYAEHHDQSYDIQGIYNTQKDVVEELFWKAKAYNKSRIEELSKILNLDKVQIKRMVIGSYIENEDIHKRPLTKFTQDIARQLKLI